MNNDFDTIIVGGGLVGAALACGIAARGSVVALLDGGDRDFRASRGNFGLVWVQGKGAEFPPYARWSGAAAKAWPEFARELQAATGIDIGLQQSGGYDFCLSADEWDARSEEMRLVRQHTQGEFEYEMLDNAALRARLPQISSEVLGASYSPQDGHVNPLFLLHALHRRMQALGCRYFADRRVISIGHDAEGFSACVDGHRYRAARLVLCAGLDNRRLAQDLGMHIPVAPLRGQLLITERVKRFLPCATLQVRQTVEGSLQIGDSHEDVGLDDSTTIEIITRLAARAVRIFPRLAGLRVVRAWGALRVMTPDGLPIYHRSERFPGAFAVSCHSGVTLAPLHAGAVAGWICGESAHPLLTHFSAHRFDAVQSGDRAHV